MCSRSCTHRTMFLSKLSRVPSLQTLLKTGFNPTLKSINQFLPFLLQSHKFDSIVNFFPQLNSNQIKLNSQTHSMIATTLLKLHKFEEAECLMVTQVVKSSNLPSIRLWDSPIRGFCIIQNDPEKALLLLKNCLKNHGILPSSFTFSSLIHTFSSQGDMSRAVEVLELMIDENTRYPYDNFVCSSVISGFCKMGKPELAVEFFQNALSSGALRPNIATYTALLSALSMLGRFEEVRDVVSGIERECLAFDVVMYSSWISGCFKEAGLEEVLRKHREMVDKGTKPDVFSYTILIDKFSKEGNVEKAVGFLWKMPEEEEEEKPTSFVSVCKEEEARSPPLNLMNQAKEVESISYQSIKEKIMLARRKTSILCPRLLLEMNWRKKQCKICKIKIGN